MPWFTAPGLVPGILGVLIASTALVIVAARASRAPRAGEPQRHRRRRRRAIRRPRRVDARAVPRLRRRPGRPRRAVLDRRGALSVPAHLPAAAAGAPRARRGRARRARRGSPSRSAHRSRSATSSRKCSWSGFPDGRPCSTASSRSAARSVGFLDFWPLVYTLGATLLGILIGCMPGLSATLAIALLTTLTIKMPPQRRDPDPDLRVRRHDLRRQPHGDPAQHPRHGGQRRGVPRRLPARAAGPGGPRDGHRDVRLGGRLAVRHRVPRAAHAGARRGRADVRRVRVLLARAVRRADVGLDRRQPIRSRAG